MYYKYQNRTIINIKTERLDYFLSYSYVLVDYIDRPPITLHTIRERPFRVVSSTEGRYTLNNMITGETKECRLLRFYKNA